MYGLPTGYKLLYVQPDAVEGIKAGDDVIHDSNVYRVFEKKEFDGPNMAVELTVSYEGSEKSPSSTDDPDWPEIVGE